MKIAVPTNDGLSISEHFGRSAAFLLFEAENARITSRERRENPALDALASNCGGHHSGSSQPHDHTAILSAIAGCDVVICAGIGRRAADALKQHGVREVIVTTPGPAEERIQAYLKGKLDSVPNLCQCSHSR